MMCPELHPGTEQERELVEALAQLSKLGLLDCVPLLQSSLCQMDHDHGYASCCFTGLYGNTLYYF